MSGSIPSPINAAPSVVAASGMPSNLKRVLLAGCGVAALGAFLWLTSGGPAPDKAKQSPEPVETSGEIGAATHPARKAPR